MVLAQDSKSHLIIRHFTILYFCYNLGFASCSKEVLKLSCLMMIIEKFDDIKFGKVLTKLYARMFSMEQFKYLPPKYSYALKDLAEFLGIFEITEDQIRQ